MATLLCLTVFLALSGLAGADADLLLHVASPQWKGVQSLGI